MMKHNDSNFPFHHFLFFVLPPPLLPFSCIPIHQRVILITMLLISIIISLYIPFSLAGLTIGVYCGWYARMSAIVASNVDSLTNGENVCNMWTFVRLKWLFFIYFLHFNISFSFPYSFDGTAFPPPSSLSSTSPTIRRRNYCHRHHHSPEC